MDAWNWVYIGDLKFEEFCRNKSSLWYFPKSQCSISLSQDPNSGCRTSTISNETTFTVICMNLQNIDDFKSLITEAQSHCTLSISISGDLCSSKIISGARCTSSNFSKRMTSPWILMTKFSTAKWNSKEKQWSSTKHNPRLKFSRDVLEVYWRETILTVAYIINCQPPHIMGFRTTMETHSLSHPI